MYTCVMQGQDWKEILLSKRQNVKAQNGSRIMDRDLLTHFQRHLGVHRLPARLGSTEQVSVDRCRAKHCGRLGIAEQRRWYTAHHTHGWGAARGRLSGRLGQRRGRCRSNVRASRPVLRGSDKGNAACPNVSSGTLSASTRSKRIQSLESSCVPYIGSFSDPPAVQASNDFWQSPASVCTSARQHCSNSIALTSSTSLHATATIPPPLQHRHRHRPRQAHPRHPAPRQKQATAPRPLPPALPDARRGARVSDALWRRFRSQRPAIERR